MTQQNDSSRAKPGVWPGKRTTPGTEGSVFDGDMVVCPDGSVGLVYHTSPTRVYVQFGADGPTASCPYALVRRATAQEIRDAGLHGVGCNEPPGGWGKASSRG